MARIRGIPGVREEIEMLHREGASIYEAGGTEGAAQTGGEYRQELRRALERSLLPMRRTSSARRSPRCGPKAKSPCAARTTQSNFARGHNQHSR
jgi:hypothetical protein